MTKPVSKWGGDVSGIVTIHKEGVLETYSVYHLSQSPEMDDIIGTDYLYQYIKDYSSLIPVSSDVTDTSWECYEPDSDVSDIIVDNTIKDYSSVSKVNPTDQKTDVKFNIKAMTSTKDNSKYFCYQKRDEGTENTTTSLYIPNRSILQYANMAGKMGFD